MRLSHLAVWSTQFVHAFSQFLVHKRARTLQLACPRFVVQLDAETSGTVWLQMAQDSRYTIKSGTVWLQMAQGSRYAIGSGTVWLQVAQSSRYAIRSGTVWLQVTQGSRYVIRPSLFLHELCAEDLRFLRRYTAYISQGQQSKTVWTARPSNRGSPVVWSMSNCLSIERNNVTPPWGPEISHVSNIDTNNISRTLSILALQSTSSQVFHRSRCHPQF